MYYSLRKFCVVSSLAALTNIVFKTQVRVAIRNELTKSPCARNQYDNANRYGKRSWNYNTTNVMDVELATSSTRSFCRRSKTLPVLPITAPMLSFPQSGTLSLPLTLLPVASSTAKYTTTSQIRYWVARPYQKGRYQSLTLSVRQK